MALPTTGIKLGEVRVDPANGVEYRYITFVIEGFPFTTWVPNTAEVLEVYASSASFPTVNVKVGELAVDPNTGVKFRYTGSAWELVTSIVGVGSSVTSGEIATGAVTAAKLATGAVTAAKLATDAVTSDKLATGAVTAAKLDPSVIQTVVVTIPTASVLTLNTTPVVLIPAPGVGKAISVESIVVSENFATVAYTGFTAMEFRYTNGLGTKIATDVFNVLDATADKAAKNQMLEYVMTENAPIVTLTSSGNPTAGDSDVKVTVSYRIVSL